MEALGVDKRREGQRRGKRRGGGWTHFLWRAIRGDRTHVLEGLAQKEKSALQRGATVIF